MWLQHWNRIHWWHFLSHLLTAYTVYWPRNASHLAREPPDYLHPPPPPPSPTHTAHLTSPLPTTTPSPLPFTGIPQQGLDLQAFSAHSGPDHCDDLTPDLTLSIQILRPLVCTTTPSVWLYSVQPPAVDWTDGEVSPCGQPPTETVTWMPMVDLGLVSWRPMTVKWWQFSSPTVIPSLALDKPSIMKRYHRQQTCSHTSPRRSLNMVMLHDTWFVKCRWWNDGWTVKTVVTWWWSASMIQAPGPNEVATLPALKSQELQSVFCFLPFSSLAFLPSVFFCFRCLSAWMAHSSVF